MTLNEVKKYTPIVGAICFSYVALYNLYGAFMDYVYLELSPDVFDFLRFGVFAAFAVLLIRRKRDVGFIVVSAIYLIWIVWSAYFEIFYYYDFLYIVDLLSVLSLFCLVLISCLPSLSAKKALSQKLWFLPAFLYFLPFLITCVSYGCFIRGTVFYCVLSTALVCLGYWLVNDVDELQSDDQNVHTISNTFVAQPVTTSNTVVPQPATTSNTVVPQSATTSFAESVSAVDRLRELKSLLDDGVLTQEDFEAKKKEILNL